MGDTSETTSGAGGSGSGGAAVAGGLVIPDLSAITAQQNENIKKMTAAVQSASGGLQVIAAQQRTALQQIIETLQASLSSSVVMAKSRPAGTLDLKPQLESFDLAIENMTKTAETLTAATGQSFDTISQTMQQSLQAIEKAAEKFSSGGQEA